MLISPCNRQFNNIMRFSPYQTFYEEPKTEQFKGNLCAILNNIKIFNNKNSRHNLNVITRGLKQITNLRSLPKLTLDDNGLSK